MLSMNLRTAAYDLVRSVRTDWDEEREPSAEDIELLEEFIHLLYDVPRIHTFRVVAILKANREISLALCCNAYKQAIKSPDIEDMRRLLKPAGR